MGVESGSNKAAVTPKPKKPHGQGGVYEVFHNVDLDEKSELRMAYDIKLYKFARDGSKMGEDEVENAVNEIRDFPSASESRRKELVTPAMLSKQPMLIRYLQIGLFYALYNAIKKNPRNNVSNELKLEVLRSAIEPVSGGRTELVKKATDDLKLTKGAAAKPVEAKPKVGFIDPLLVDPVVPMTPDEIKQIKSADIAQNVDQGIDAFYDKIFEGKQRMGNKGYTPTQRLVLAFAYTKFFEPILNNLKAVDVARLNPSLKDIPFDSISRELSKLARDEGRMILKQVIFAKDFDIRNLRNLVSAMMEFIDDYNHSILPSLFKLDPRRAAINFGLDMGKEPEDIEKKEGREGRNISILRSILELSREAAYVISPIEKRKIDDVARLRSGDPREFERLRLLVQFLASFREKTRSKSNKMLTASLDFVLSILSRMRDDKELAQLGKSIKPILQYIFQIPDGPKDAILQNPKLRAFVDKNPVVLDIAFQFFIPEKAALSEKAEKQFEAKYGALFGLLKAILKNSKIPIDANTRYLLAFSLENLKSYFGGKDEGRILKVLALVNGLLKPYKAQIPKYVELVAILTKLGVEMVG